MAPDQPVRPAAGVRWAEALDEVVVLDTDSGASWLLDPAGALIWRALVSGGSVDGAVAALARPGEEEAARAEVEAFVEVLVGRGTVVAG